MDVSVEGKAGLSFVGVSATFGGDFEQEKQLTKPLEVSRLEYSTGCNSTMGYVCIFE